MGNLLCIKDLNYKNILDNISCNITEKSFNILVGKNGVGKTTLVKCILELIKYKGNINLNIKKEDIGCISDFSCITCDDVYTYLSEPLLNIGYSDDKAKKAIYSIARKLNISSLINKEKKCLNAEQKVLVLIAHAVIHKPQLIIIDNTLEELSYSNRQKLINYLTNINSTVILVTNDSKYFKYANKILLLTPNKIEEIKGNKSIDKLENKLIKSHSELPFNLELSLKLYSYGMLNKLYNTNRELIDEIWKQEV